MIMQFDGDITAVIAGIICHTADNKGLMSEESSQRIGEKWPIVRSEYLSLYVNRDLRLGEVIFTNANRNNPHLQVATMVCEDRSSTPLSNLPTHLNCKGNTKLDYIALSECIEKVCAWHGSLYNGTLPIYIPHGMGCSGLKGNWSVAKTIIRNKIPKAIIIRESRF